MSIPSRLWAWFTGIEPWQQVVLVIAAGAAVGLIVAGAWEALGVLASGALGLRPAAAGARAVGRKAKALRRTADTAGALLDAVTELDDAHTEADGATDAAIREADDAAIEARHADAPADSLAPLRFNSLGES